MKKLLILLIRFYQAGLSPYIGARCRFIPSCSEYFVESLETHGFLKGVLSGTRRICRCHPWGGSGFDPVRPVRK